MKHQTLMIILLLSGCLPPPSNEGYGSRTHLTGSADQTKPSSSLLLGDEEQGEDVEYVSALKIQSADFKLNMVSITYQIVVDQNFPVISYILPIESDYIEILRCQAQLPLSHNGRGVREWAAAESKEEHFAMTTGDFWNKALVSRQCVMVGFEYSSHSQFTDVTILTGQHFYLARACVIRQKISQMDRLVMGTSTCSPYVSQSSNFHFTRHREMDDVRHMVDLTNAGIKLESSLLKIENSAVQLVDALEKCDVSEADRQIRVRQKTALNKIISSVAGLIADFALPGGATYSQAGSMMGKVKNLGKRLGGAQYLASPLFQVLEGFTSSPDDFPKTCYEGDRLHRNLLVQAEEVQGDHLHYSQLINTMSEGLE